MPKLAWKIGGVNGTSLELIAGIHKLLLVCEFNFYPKSKHIDAKWFTWSKGLT